MNATHKTTIRRRPLATVIQANRSWVAGVVPEVKGIKPNGLHRSRPLFHWQQVEEV